MSCCQGPTSFSICGSFPPPANPDLGKCFPYREKRDCEAPVLPGADCSDDAYSVDYDPDQTPMFRAISTLFDSNCDPIVDKTLAAITTQSI